MLLKDGNETVAMSRLKKMYHFVDYNIFEQILWLLHQFGVETDVAGPMIAASPLGFHPLQKVSGDSYFQLWLPLLDERRHDFVK